ncbi:DLW-39 family protein [Nesterenkonia lutea]
MKRIVFAALSVAGILGYRQWRRAEDAREVWSRATDSV